MSNRDPNEPALTGLASDLATEIRNNPHSVLCVVGTGVSIAATKNQKGASWRSLLESGIEECQKILNPPPSAEWVERMKNALATQDLTLWLEVASAVSVRLSGPTSGAYRKWLQESIGGLKVQDDANLKALAALNQLGVQLATTNYDKLLAHATGLSPVLWTDPSGFHELLVRRRTGIYHLHGHYDRPESVIFSREDYERILKDERAQALQQALHIVKTWLFVGFGNGLSDPNFGKLQIWSKSLFSGSSTRHYQLVTDKEFAAAASAPGQDPRLYKIPYGPDHQALPHFLQRLVAAAQPGADPVVAAAPTPAVAGPPVAAAPTPAVAGPPVAAAPTPAVAGPPVAAAPPPAAPVVAAAPTAPTGAKAGDLREPLVILHCSDLHRGHPDEAAGQTPFEKLLVDIQQMRGKVGVPDALFFTGDLAFGGEQEHYQDVRESLRRIKEATGNPELVIVAVPGNHDLKRPPSDDMDRVALRSYFAPKDRDVRKNFKAGKSSVLSPIRKWFAEYRAFWDEVQKENKSVSAYKEGPLLLPGDFTMTIERKGWRLGVAGVNSAFLQLGDRKKEEGCLAVELEQLVTKNFTLSTWRAQHHACLLLMHHPPSWLHPEAEVAFYSDIYDPGYFAACLCGHRHRSALFRKNERYFLQAPSLFGLQHYGEAEEERQMGYSWLILSQTDASRGQLRRWGRIGNTEDGSWGFVDLRNDPFFLDLRLLENR